MKLVVQGPMCINLFTAITPKAMLRDPSACHKYLELLSPRKSPPQCTHHGRVAAPGAEALIGFRKCLVHTCGVRGGRVTFRHFTRLTPFLFPVWAKWRPMLACDWPISITGLHTLSSLSLGPAAGTQPCGSGPFHRLSKTDIGFISPQHHHWCAHHINQAHCGA